ncbi:MAG: hypothetical protein FK734_06935 [Asgard group archaeon]|nr:hypothetical protein [Asgard group archaeon]
MAETAEGIESHYIDTSKWDFTNLTPLKKRNAIFWMVAFVVTGGLSSIIHLWLSYNDINELYKYPKGDVDFSPNNITIKTFLFGWFTCTLITFGMFIIFYPYYLKFESLNEYLEKHPIKQQTKTIGGIGYALTGFFFILSLLGGLFAGDVVNLFTVSNPSVATFLTVLSIILYIFAGILYILKVYFNLNWQQAYNERAEILNQYLVKKN